MFPKIALIIREIANGLRLHLDWSVTSEFIFFIYTGRTSHCLRSCKGF